MHLKLSRINAFLVSSVCAIFYSQSAREANANFTHSALYVRHRVVSHWPTVFVCGGNINQDALRLGRVTTFRAESLNVCDADAEYAISLAHPRPTGYCTFSRLTATYFTHQGIVLAFSHRHTGKDSFKPSQRLLFYTNLYTAQ